MSYLVTLNGGPRAASYAWVCSSWSAEPGALVLREPYMPVVAFDHYDPQLHPIALGLPWSLVPEGFTVTDWPDS